MTKDMWIVFGGEALIGALFFVVAWVVGSTIRDAERQAEHPTPRRR
jgi:hypothetical protein